MSHTATGGVMKRAPTSHIGCGGISHEWAKPEDKCLQVEAQSVKLVLPVLAAKPLGPWEEEGSSQLSPHKVSKLFTNQA